MAWSSTLLPIPPLISFRISHKQRGEWKTVAHVIGWSIIVAGPLSPFGHSYRRLAWLFRSGLMYRGSQIQGHSWRDGGRTMDGGIPSPLEQMPLYGVTRRLWNCLLLIALLVYQNWSSPLVTKINHSMHKTTLENLIRYSFKVTDFKSDVILFWDCVVASEATNRAVISNVHM